MAVTDKAAENVELKYYNCFFVWSNFWTSERAKEKEKESIYNIKEFLDIIAKIISWGHQFCLTPTVHCDKNFGCYDVTSCTTGKRTDGREVVSSLECVDQYDAKQILINYYEGKTTS